MRRLNRIKLRREHELEEFNFGINFAQLKSSKDQQARLRLYLMKQQQKLNEYVEMGTGPVFGYPPICYSPPNELKKSGGKREYLSVLMRHVFQKPETLATIKDLIDAKNQQDALLQTLMKRFMSGKRKDTQGGAARGSERGHSMMFSQQFGDKNTSNFNMQQRIDNYRGSQNSQVQKSGEYGNTEASIKLNKVKRSQKR